MPDGAGDMSLLMGAVTELTGVSLVCKSASGGIAVERLLNCQRMHLVQFCRRIKGLSHEKERKCIHNDAVLAPAKCLSLRKAFVNRCHAGALELTVPVFSGGSLEAVFFFGPFRGRGSDCGYECAGKEYQRLKILSAAKIRAVKNILSNLGRRLIEDREAQRRRGIAEKTRNERVRKALDHIDRNFAKPLTAPETAELCGLSVSRFLHVFKQECGRGFSECLRGRRIEEAKKFLAETNMRISEAAALCGYSGQCYFGLVFRKETGMTPAAYRKKFKRIPEP